MCLFLSKTCFDYIIGGRFQIYSHNQIFMFHLGFYLNAAESHRLITAFIFRCGWQPMRIYLNVHPRIVRPVDQIQSRSSFPDALCRFGLFLIFRCVIIKSGHIVGCDGSQRCSLITEQAALQAPLGLILGHLR